MIQYSCFNCGVDVSESHHVRFFEDGARPICEPCRLNTHTIITPPCPHCGSQSELTLPRKNLDDWWGGMLIQRAFPELPADQRELLITGFHPECFKEVFNEAF